MSEVKLEIISAQKIVIKEATESEEGTTGTPEEGYIEVIFAAPRSVSDPEEVLPNQLILCMPLDYTGATVGRKVSIYL